MALIFACCFCGQGIEEPQVPKSLILVWGDEEAEGDWQQWWCHLDCFVESIDPRARNFAWEDEEMTI